MALGKWGFGVAVDLGRAPLFWVFLGLFGFWVSLGNLGFPVLLTRSTLVIPAGRPPRAPEYSNQNYL